MANGFYGLNDVSAGASPEDILKRLNGEPSIFQQGMSAKQRLNSLNGQPDIFKGISAEQRLNNLNGQPNIFGSPNNLYGLNKSQIIQDGVTTPKPQYKPDFRMVNNNLPTIYQAPPAQPQINRGSGTVIHPPLKQVDPVNPSLLQRAKDVLNKPISLGSVLDTSKSGLSAAAKVGKAFAKKIPVIGAGVEVYDGYNEFDLNKGFLENAWTVGTTGAKVAGNLIGGIPYSSVSLGSSLGSVIGDYIGNEKVEEANRVATQVDQNEIKRLAAESMAAKAKQEQVAQEKGQEYTVLANAISDVNNQIGSVIQAQTLGESLKEVANPYSDSYDINGNQILKSTKHKPMLTYNTPEEAAQQRKIDADTVKMREELALKADISKLEDLVSKRRVPASALLAAHQRYANWQQGNQQGALAQQKLLADQQAEMVKAQQALGLQNLKFSNDKQMEAYKAQLKKQEIQDQRDYDAPHRESEIAYNLAKAKSLTGPQYEKMKQQGENGEYEVLYDKRTGQIKSQPTEKDLYIQKLEQRYKETGNKAFLETAMKQLSDVANNGNNAK